jgi:hypothetical protein
MLNPRQFKRVAPPGMMWHGTPDERTWGQGNAHYGIHIGTEQAAKDALHARIGKPVEGEWRGNREYSKTLLEGSSSRSMATGARDTSADYHPQPASYREIIRHPKGRGVDYGPPVSRDERDPSKLYSAKGAHYSGGIPVPMDAHPSIFPVRIKGPMTNSPSAPHEDFRANGYMAGQLKQGRAKKGYYYENVAEDEGSISAVVPGASHLERLDPKPQFGRATRYGRARS